VKELSKLREPIPEEELERAKNILIASIYANIERQSDRLEELTKHVQVPLARSILMAA
jgi:predicted Zn-dependent peptidase